MLIGREPDRLTRIEQIALNGKWIALEVYTPDKMPLRRIAAVGESAADCMSQVVARGGDPRQFEYRTFRM